MKKLSCGFIIKTERGILACHATGKPMEDGSYDVPKGGCEKGEDPFDAAKRELKEETGLDFDTLQVRRMVDCGVMNYRNDKDLNLFLIEIKDFPFDFKLHCDSMFENKRGEMIPEMDGYKWVKNENAFYRSLRPLLKEIDEKHNLFGEIKGRYFILKGLYRHVATGNYYYVEQPSIFVKDEDNKWNRTDYVLYRALYCNTDGPFFVRTKKSFIKDFVKVDNLESCGVMKEIPRPTLNNIVPQTDNNSIRLMN